MGLLDDITARLGALSPDDRKQFEAVVARGTAGRRFIPNPGPQTDAYFCKADLLLYGGAGGGGKTGLIAGLAIEEHRRTLIIRKFYSDLLKGGGLIDEVLKFYGSRAGFNGSAPAMLRMGDGKVITFGGVSLPGDEEKFQGQPRDFLGIDEATQLSEYQVRFLMGWVRSEVPGQRTRTILATNPPLSGDGDWVIGMFRPWLDLTHHRPAEPGELRWYVTDPDGKDMEVNGPEPYLFPGASRAVLPQSRTFIPAKLADNPFLIHDTKYQATQDSFPEPMRSAIRDGNFMLARQDSEWQVIPTEWVRAAQQRWTAEPPQHAPMSALGVDVAQGGADQTVIACRYDGWYAPLVVYPGAETPDGPSVAGRVLIQRRNGAVVIVDCGGGYGGSASDHLKGNGIDVHRHVGAEGSVRRTVDGALPFHNKRAEVWWRFREALDPSQAGGSPIMLPDDAGMVSDLVAPTFDTSTGKIKVEPKEKLVARIGRSPDRGDAVVMAWSRGPKMISHARVWKEYGKTPGGSPRVMQSRPNARRR